MEDEMYSKLMGLILLVSLMGCGSSEDNEGSRFKKNENTNTTDTTEVTQNVALDANGGVIREATYDANAAKYAIDGDKTSSDYWAGNTTNESFVIGFKNTVEITRVNVYSNISSGSQANPPITIEVSTNQRTWRTMVDTASNGGIQCSESGFSGNTFICLMSDESARYIRIGTKSSATNIYEVEVTGK
jgi:hypothetical protein